jgi:hypothetical protein
MCINKVGPTEQIICLFLNMDLFCIAVGQWDYRDVSNGLAVRYSDIIFL